MGEDPKGSLRSDEASYVDHVICQVPDASAAGLHQATCVARGAKQESCTDSGAAELSGGCFCGLSPRVMMRHFLVFGYKRDERL